MNSDIWFGVQTPLGGRTFNDVRVLCVRAEELGYDLFTVTDHLLDASVDKNPNVPAQNPIECWTTLSALAAVTQRIRLGSLVTCYAYRAPTMLAKMATTVDIISRGRLVFGIGAGWHEEEFKEFFGRFPSVRERLKGLEETIEICKSMFVNERTTYKGLIFNVENVLNSPQPVKMPSILVGGGGEKKTLKIAAKHADISHFSAQNMEMLNSKLAALRSHCKSANRDYEEIRKAIGCSAMIDSSTRGAEQKLRRMAKARGRTIEQQLRWVGPAYGTPEKIANSLENYTSKGIGLITLTFYNVEDMELFAEQVIPHLK